MKKENITFSFDKRTPTTVITFLRLETLHIEPYNHEKNINTLLQCYLFISKWFHCLDNDGLPRALKGPKSLSTSIQMIRNVLAEFNQSIWNERYFHLLCARVRQQNHFKLSSSSYVNISRLSPTRNQRDCHLVW